MKIEMSDFCSTTVKVITDHNVFYVQTVDAEFRYDLGCWITTEEEHEDISARQRYADELPGVIKAAENFMNRFKPDDS